MVFMAVQKTFFNKLLNFLRKSKEQTKNTQKIMYAIIERGI